MYKCDECGEVFEEPVEQIEDTGEIWNASPCCKSDYERVNVCECGQTMGIGEKFCEECQEEIQKKFNELLQSNFTEEEIEYLNNVYDGEEF